jgi:hypothetical protein
MASQKSWGLAAIFAIFFILIGVSTVVEKKVGSSVVQGNPNGTNIIENQLPQLSAVGGCDSTSTTIENVEECYQETYEYEFWNPNTEQEEEVHAQIILYLGETQGVLGQNDDGVFIVEEGAHFQYECKDINQQMDAVLLNEYGVNDIEVSADEYGATFLEGENIPLKGKINIDAETPTEYQISCLGWEQKYDSVWAYTYQSVWWSERYMVGDDSDNDRVYDIEDQCSGTPSGVEVNDQGCAVDSDGDGVPDYQDEFPNDPNCQDDSDGDGVCDSEDAFPDDPSKTADSDGDGVADVNDQCPGTDPGTSVNENGCPVDSDDDGVPDIDDECSDTSSSTQVNENGCPLDSDNDGVPNKNDECSGTPSGAEVDQEGCAVDTDNDGVADINDSCPETYGSRTNGCPTLWDKIINTLGIRGWL